MPHVRRSMLITVDADPDRVHRALVDDLELVATDTGHTGPIQACPTRRRGSRWLSSRTATSTAVRLDAVSDVIVPFFTWFLRMQARLGARRALPHAAARVEAAVHGQPPPPPVKPLPVVPPVPFTPEQAARLGALAAVALLANFCGALLSQNGDAVTSAFGRSDQALGVALAVARAGVLVSLVAIALADRWGRRRLILVAMVGACAANAVTAVAPTFEVFTGAAPHPRPREHRADRRRHRRDRGRTRGCARSPPACSRWPSAPGSGSRSCCCLADLGDYGWRISFAVSAALVFLVPVIARHLKETQRFVQVAVRSARRGRLREVVDSAYGKRFLLLGLAAFLTNVFSAPSSQLTNRYLTHAHDFSNSDVAVFRTVTAGCPASSACCWPAASPRAGAGVR